MKSVVITFVLFALVSGAIYDGITVKSVTRNIDLTTQFSRQTTAFTFSNEGSKAASEVYVAYDSKLAEHLSLIEAHDQSGASLKVEKSDSQTAGGRSFILYRVELGKNLASGESADVRVSSIFTHTLIPFPIRISQFEKQLVRYFDNHFISSPYKVKAQTTTVKLATSHIERHSEEGTTTVKGDTITYGPYSDSASFHFSELHLHFENNAPFLTVNRLQKDIEISHYGNIAIEETYTLSHDGAALKGVFSRYDYQRSQGRSPAHIPIFKQILPDGAADLYYRDEIGNISTSHESVTDRGVTLELIPRFPLFGGWKFGFYMGYNLPTEPYLFRDADRSGAFLLNTSFATTFDDAVIDELVVRIILPEGASDIESYVPFPIDGKSFEHHYTYLDTTGRPVLVLTKKNVVSDHNQRFQVTYNFSQTRLLQEPFLLVITFFLVFLVIMIYVRAEFNIGGQKQRNPNADKVEEILLRVKDAIDQQVAQHSDLDSVLNAAIRSNDTSTYTSKKNRIDLSLTKSKDTVHKLAIELDQLDAEVARKVREIERKEDEKIAAQQQLHDIEISHKIRKQSTRENYEASKAKAERSYSAIDEELGDLVKNLIGDL